MEDYSNGLVKELEKWVSDLQSGKYINCVYCGHRYEPGTPGVMSQVLYEHIKICPKHPLSKAETRIKDLQEYCDKLGEMISSQTQKRLELEVNQGSG